MENQNRVTCLDCNIEYGIKEIPISRVGKEKETAECLQCGKVIYRGKTSGTFKAIEVENTKK